MAHRSCCAGLLIAPERDTFGKQLDETLLSKEKRRRFVHEPLRTFFAEIPTARRPEEVVASAA